jgi:hypothetical protein
MTSQGHNESELVHVPIHHLKGLSECIRRFTRTVSMHTFVVFGSLQTGEWGSKVVTDLERKGGGKKGLEVLVAVMQRPQNLKGCIVVGSKLKPKVVQNLLNNLGYLKEY